MAILLEEENSYIPGQLFPPMSIPIHQKDLWQMQVCFSFNLFVVALGRGNEHSVTTFLQ